MKRFLILSLTLLSLASCNTLDIKGLVVGSSPNANARYARSKSYNEANGFKQLKVNSDDYEVYLCTDSHVSNSAEGLTRFVNDYLVDGDAAPFALFIGDAMDGSSFFGNFRSAISPIEKSGRELFCTPGNHDLYFGQWDQYIGAMKTATYYFEVLTPSEVKDLYICLDSSEGTLGTDQRAWLEHILLAPRDCVPYRNIIVFTHTHFFKKDNTQGHTSNYNIEEGYDLENMFSKAGVDVVISGHDHSFEETVFKGVKYLTLASICDKGEYAFYYKLKVTSDETNLTSVRIR